MEPSAERTCFSLDGTGLKLNEAEDIEPFLGVLRGLKEVKEVELSANTLGVGACKALADVLRTKESITYVNIADIFTGRLLTEIPPALTHLLEALVTLPNLYTVDLSDNAFGLNTQAPLVAFLSAHIPLRKLILNNNGLGPRAGRLIAEALTELAVKKEESRKAGQSVPDLETIVCGRNRLENGSMAAWAKAFAAHRGIKEVKMTQNGIRPEGIETLLRNGLKHATDLQVLDLQDNTFTLQGATALADVVSGWGSLIDLGVGDCLLKKRGSILLFKALQKGSNPKLQALRLAFNDVDVAGLGELRRAISDSLPKLRRVELNGNRFSDVESDVEDIRDILLDRVGEEEGQEPVMDELEDMEEDESESESESEEEAEDVEKKAEKVIKDDEKAEQEEVAQEKDESVDELVRKLGQTTV
ncbi:MAG: hypothetical protein M1813_002937 [Trichoglossum hirsutum]|nr:MAG: hypothetical protein M1813_002937 [Trichoglossum hirsutum]